MIELDMISYVLIVIYSQYLPVVEVLNVVLR